MGQHDRRAIAVDYNGVRLRVEKHAGGGLTGANAFLYHPDVAAPVLLEGYRVGMTVGEVKELARAAAAQIEEARRRFREGR